MSKRIVFWPFGQTGPKASKPAPATRFNAGGQHPAYRSTGNGTRWPGKKGKR